MSSEEYCICFKDVEDAYENIKTHVNLTPVLTASSLSNLSCSNLFFKCEAFQKTGSFKFRGAMNAVINLCGQNEHDEKHCVTHSSGNHAAALALAARLAPHSNVKATIVMPENAPIIKVNGVRGFGGNIVFVESTNEARESKADEIVLEQNAYFVHPSENKNVIAGQGTVSIEFVEQVREMIGADLDAVVIPVGGGGLAAGNTIALRGLLGNKVKIILAEPEVMDDAKRSKESGILVGHDPGNPLNSVADGLKTTLGPNTWPIIRDLVDDIITVSEKDILRATKLVWERLKVAIEPSAGVGVAVSMNNAFKEKYSHLENIGIILCGGNVDIIKIASLMSEMNL